MTASVSVNREPDLDFPSSPLVQSFLEGVPIAGNPPFTVCLQILTASYPLLRSFQNGPTERADLSRTDLNTLFVTFLELSKFHRDGGSGRFVR